MILYWSISREADTIDKYDALLRAFMNVIRLLPVWFSVLLLGAHFYRADQLALVFVSVAIPLVLLIRRPWAVRAVQLELFAGGIVWIITMVNIILMRHLIWMPWVGFVLVIGAIIILTFGSIFVFRAAPLRERYHI